MGYKIMIHENTSECPTCGYRWNTNFGITDLVFNEKEKCLCCPECGELIEDGDDN
ncbi:hypothetical protein [uncultured Eubacterium sp.]|uniref:hypothetical protein n=1 Tax=uncultured Eubacterium sp. TaxID=165185 RepID=UPI0025916518|nr:hypothetical protein [uncultured Eubacterium sp.]